MGQSTKLQNLPPLGLYSNGQLPTDPGRTGEVPLAASECRKRTLVTGAQASISLHQLLASYLTVWGAVWRRVSPTTKENTTVQNWEPAGSCCLGGPQARAAELAQPPLWEPTMGALCSSRHSGEPSMKKEGLMPSPQYQADAGGGSGQKKEMET